MTGTFAAVFAALYAAHQVADHWIQTQHQVDRKGKAGWAGRWNCAKHVATYGLTQIAALGLLAALAGLRVSPAALAAGMAINLGSHYIADRRTPLRWLADMLRKNPDWLEKGGGLYALDQSWHIGWLFVASLVVVA